MGTKAKITSRQRHSDSDVELQIREVMSHASDGRALLGKPLGGIELNGRWQFVAENAVIGPECKEAIQKVWALGASSALLTKQEDILLAGPF